MTVGRQSSYDPAYCDAVVELGHAGESFTGIAVKLGVTKTTIYRWMDDYPDFRAAMERARECNQVAWESLMRTQAVTGKGNATAGIFMMKNLFPDDFKDRREHDVSGKVGVFEIDFTGYDDDEDEGEDES